MYLKLLRNRFPYVYFNKIPLRRRLTAHTPSNVHKGKRQQEASTEPSWRHQDRSEEHSQAPGLRAHHRDLTRCIPLFKQALPTLLSMNAALTLGMQTQFPSHPDFTKYPELEGSHRDHWPSSCPCTDIPTIPSCTSLRALSKY